jgi:hypothetical protein
MTFERNERSRSAGTRCHLEAHSAGTTVLDWQTRAISTLAHTDCNTVHIDRVLTPLHSVASHTFKWCAHRATHLWPASQHRAPLQGNLPALETRAAGHEEPPRPLNSILSGRCCRTERLARPDGRLGYSDQPPREGIHRDLSTLQRDPMGRPRRDNAAN